MSPIDMARPGISIARIDPRDTLNGATLSSMNFLNEAAGRYPHAISLAAGRPPNRFIESHRAAHWLQEYVTLRAKSASGGEASVWTAVGQYADTDGTIRELVAGYVEAVEDVPAQQLQLRVTNGFQEALLIELAQLRLLGGAVITFDPTYVGLTGAAMVAGVPLFAVASGGDPGTALDEAIMEAKSAGFAHIAAYLIPDYDNPTGRSMSLVERTSVLEIAARHSVTLLEDTAYRLFNFEGARLPSLLQLDREGRVLQLGSFSKVFMPGVRVGFSARRMLSTNHSDHGTAIKSFVSVTTSPLAQAIVGGFLIEMTPRLDEWNAQRVAFCRMNRDIMLETLSTHLGELPGVRWSRPSGGFFLVVQVPFEFDADSTVDMAENEGVIATPMTFFSPSGCFRNEVRLSFSTNEPAAIRTGVQRFATYVQRRLRAS